MSADFASLGPVCSVDLSSIESKNIPQQVRIEKVSKAMESIFVGQLTAEMGKSIDGSSDSDSGDGSDGAGNGGPYQDFIQQAMTQGVTSGGGLGLAKIIENSLTPHTKPTGPMKLEIPNTSYHVTHAQ
jgi:Rod binding domain-containing protein